MNDGIVGVCDSDGTISLCGFCNGVLVVVVSGSCGCIVGCSGIGTEHIWGHCTVLVGCVNDTFVINNDTDGDCCFLSSIN